MISKCRLNPNSDLKTDPFHKTTFRRNYETSNGNLLHCEAVMCNGY